MVEQKGTSDVMAAVYVHYGNDAFESEYFAPVRNNLYFPKPEGGLWASREDDENGWAAWCRQERFKTFRLKHFFKFTLAPDSRVLTLESEDQLLDLPKLKPWKPKDLRWMYELKPDEHPSPEQLEEWFQPNPCLLDYEKMARQGIDAIEMIGAGAFIHSLKTWDCNCLFVMNPDIILL